MFDPHKLALDCISGEAPPCACACPLGVDVRDLIERLKIGSNTAAYKAFTKVAALPGVVAHICPAPCREACVRMEADEPIELGKIERFLFREMSKTPPRTYFIPEKKKRILVVGGGVAGITAALRLAGRGYAVRLAERRDRLGGALWDLPETLLPRDVLETDLRALEALKYLEISLNDNIAALPEGEYDSILVATGAGGDDFGAVRDEDGGLRLRDGVFFTGGVRDPDGDFLGAMREGSDLTYLMENYMKVGRMETLGPPPQRCQFKPRADNFERVPSFLGGEDPSAGDVKAEAARCLLCSCSECVDVCDMLAYFRKNPKKTIIDVSDTINSTPLAPKAALRQIMSCTACGLCKPACPVEIDFKTICLESRQLLRAQGQLPAAHYEYWVNDMAHANGDDAALFRAPEGAKTEYVYFPGCQMGAADPDYVRRSYDWLREHFAAGTALELACCGAPAQWAGDTDLHGEMCARIRRTWRENGEPAYILACPTCMEMFAEFLPEIRVVSLWGLLAERLEKAESSRGTVSLFDPCGTTEVTRKDVREILSRLGYELRELPETGRCCGHGGLVYTGNPGLHSHIAARNAELSSLPYITYCTNCRDTFAMREKPALYLLDAVFGDGGFDRAPPDPTLRRRNREALKKSLLPPSEAADFKASAGAYEDIVLIIPDAVRAKMARELILEDNIRLVIKAAEESGRRIFKKSSGVYTAYSLQGRLTFWVDYTADGGVYTVSNVYFHRMTIGDLTKEGS